MCGRYTLTRVDHIADDFGAALGDAPRSEWWKPRFNVAPTQPAPVIVAQGGARRIEMMRWGLVPHWAGPGGKRAPLMINARSESLDAKAIFRDAVRRRRCLVPADGFFEWLKAGKAKPRPIYMHPASRRLFAFAGLWASHRAGAPGGAASADARDSIDTIETLSFTIITGKPNELVKPFHDRMPIALDPSTYAAWLDPALDAEAAHAMLGIPPVGDWVAEPVSTLVNSVVNDEPACIEPLPASPPAQQTLFD